MIASTQQIDMSRLIKRVMLIFFLPLILLLAIAYYIYQTETAMDRNILSSQERTILSVHEKSIQQIFTGIISDLQVLAADYDLGHMLQNPEDIDEHLTALSIEFPSFVAHKNIYDQIRLLDRSGQEVVRADLKNDKVYLASQNELQNKAGRYYFRETMALNPGEVFMSPLDLNIEHGKIEIPVKPMIRAATPIVDTEGNKQGMVILNYRGNHLIQRLENIPTTGRIQLLNVEGYWLKGPSPEDEWGFMYPERQDVRFPARSPDAWERISANESGQFVNSSGMYTFGTIRPLVTLGVTDYHWKLLSFIPLSKLNQLAESHRRNAIVLSSLLAIFWFIISIIIAHGKEQDRLRKLIIEQKDEEIREIINSAMDGIITIDDRGIIGSVNPAACAMFGYAEEELTGNSIAMLAADSERDFDDAYMERYIRIMRHYYMGSPREVMVRRKDGSLFPMELSGNGKKVNGKWLYTGVCRDISQRKQMIAQLETLATTDNLTGLNNRGHFNLKLEEEFQRSKRYSQHLSLLILDADLFKNVNDNYGHPAGDAYLIALAKQILMVARQVDIVARYGGEEFVIILPQTDGDEAMIMAERLRTAVEKLSIEFEGHTISCTASIGVANLKETKAKSADDLLTIADRALYSAKESGRNRVVIAGI